MRKIDLMHEMFGIGSGTCKDCDNLICNIANHRWYKCLVYGNSASEATDWRVSYPACGMKNKAYSGNPVVALVRPEKKEEQIEGQMSLKDYLSRRGECHG